MIKPNLSKFPNSPGVYIFFNEANIPIYIGKSKSLKNRISSYFLINVFGKTKQMINNASYIKILPTLTEFEALINENNLIKKYKPKYNIELKDDKKYVYICISNIGVVSIERLSELDNHKYQYTFGPILSKKIAYLILNKLREIIPFSTHNPSKAHCIYKEIGLCNPCISDTDKLSKIKYRKNINKLLKLLKTGTRSTIISLEKEMNKYSRKKDYEKAKETKNKIGALHSINNLRIIYENVYSAPNYYQDTINSELASLNKLLSKHLLKINLKRVECFDVSHFSGKNPTSSMTVMINGVIQNNLFRRFKLSSDKASDDLMYMEETIKRRKKHFKDWGKPDLVIVDGGKEQVKVFMKHLPKMNVIGLEKLKEKLVIPVLTDQNKIEFIRVQLDGLAKNLVTRLRDETHRFANSYRKILVKKETNEKAF